MTRLVHIGDVHLQHGHQRNVDRLAALDQIVAENVSRPGLGAWLIPGDLFHQKSTAEDRNALADRLTRMAAVAPVCLVRGNHDQIGDLDIFAKLNTRWPIYVFTRPGIYDVPAATNAMLAIAAVPYPDKHGLVAGAVAPGDISAVAAQALDVVFLQLGHDLATARVGGALCVFMGHFNVRGAVASTGQPQIGHEQEVDRLSLERLPVVYCALSHIHEPQEVGVGVYAGSIAAMDYGESTPRSYVVVEAERVRAGWQATWSRQPINTPQMDHVEGRLTPSGFRLKEHPDAELEYQAGAWSGHDVRVRYSYLSSEKAVIDDRCIRELFKDALRLKVEGFAIPDRELRAPEVAAAKTLPEKLAAFRKVEQLEPTVADKLQQLHQDDRDVFLAHVAAQLAAIEMPERALVAA